MNLISLGYDKNVLMDEFQAYAYEGFTCEEVVKGLNFKELKRISKIYQENLSKYFEF